MNVFLIVNQLGRGLLIAENLTKWRIWKLQKISNSIMQCFFSSLIPEKF